ncbi:MAG: hypothetical protein ACRD04_05145 [Terriglobales bacterium]
MSEAAAVRTSPRPAARVSVTALLRSGPRLFAIGIAAVGIGNVVWVRQTALLHALPSQPVLRGLLAFPNFPPVAAVGYILGGIMAALGVALLVRPQNRSAALALAVFFLLCALIIGLPRYWDFPGDIALRTTLFQELLLGAMACLLPGRGAIPAGLARVCRYVMGAALIVFGAGHFLALKLIAGMVPGWMPGHVFWAVFFGLAFILAGLSIAGGWLLDWGAGLAGAMFAVFLLALHLPAALGAYGPVRWDDANNWTSVAIVLAFWGGLWALASRGCVREHGRAEPAA